MKNILTTDGYQWDDSLIIVKTIIKACKILNDQVYKRFPIRAGFLEMILFEVQRMFNTDLYLEMLYKTIFLVSYYGLLRISEISSINSSKTLGHCIKACDVHIGQNKPKMLLILYSSKMHGRESKPQKVKIQAVDEKHYGKSVKRHFCPFQYLRSYIDIRGSYEDPSEPLFVYKHKVIILQALIRKVLKTAINRLGVNAALYDFHSLRAGRTTDLISLGFPVDQVKRMDDGNLMLFTVI